MAARKQPPAPAGESGEELPKLAEQQEKAIEDAEASASEGGGGNPVLHPEDSTKPTPGTTGELDVVSTDEATSLNPNITVSGTKPDGKGGQVLLDTVDPAVANAALLGPAKAVKPESPSIAPENTDAPPKEGEVRFRVTADNKPFYSGGQLHKGDVVTMSKEEADLLVQLKAGQIEGSSAPASDSNSQVEGQGIG